MWGCGGGVWTGCVGGGGEGGGERGGCEEEEECGWGGGT